MSPVSSNKLFDGWSVEDLGYFHEVLKEMGFLFYYICCCLGVLPVFELVLFVRCVHVVASRPQ